MDLSGLREYKYTSDCGLETLRLDTVYLKKDKIFGPLHVLFENTLWHVSEEIGRGKWNL